MNELLVNSIQSLVLNRLNRPRLPNLPLLHLLLLELLPDGYSSSPLNFAGVDRPKLPLSPLGFFLLEEVFFLPTGEGEAGGVYCVSDCFGGGWGKELGLA